MIVKPDIWGDVMRVRLELPADDALRYRGGQYINILLPDGESWITATEKARQSDAGVPIAWVPFV